MMKISNGVVHMVHYQKNARNNYAQSSLNCLIWQFPQLEGDIPDRKQLVLVGMNWIYMRI